MTRHGAVRIGRLAGIPVGIQPLWLVIVGLLTWSLGAERFPDAAPGIAPVAAYALGLVSALLLFAGIVAHELGHAVAARRHGVRIDEIDLWLLGGVARMRDEPRDPRDELRFAAAGPAVTLVIACAFGGVRLLLGDGGPAWLRAAIDYQLVANAAILAFNLLPAFPLDGGRILRAALWLGGGDHTRATDRAAAAGRVFGWGFVVLGLLGLSAGAPAGIWTTLIGGFLVLAGRAEQEHVRVEAALGGWHVAEVMAEPAVVVRADDTIEQALHDLFVGDLHCVLPVVDGDGHTAGLLVLADVRALAPAQRRVTLVRELMRRAPDIVVAPDDDLGAVVERPAFQRFGVVVAVDDRGAPLGVVGTHDTERLLVAGDIRTPA